MILFLVIQCFVDIDGFVNARSRWATMVAMTEQRTFCIDRYREHTIDWARTPDGHYFSNKAPGPALIGFPLFWVVDRALTSGLADADARDAQRVASRREVLHWLSIITQAVPQALLVLLLVRAMQELAFPTIALHVAAVAILFGNTGSLFMNTYFGHGMAEMFTLALLLALHRRDLPLAGLFLGFTILSDYSGALLVPPVFLFLGLRRGRLLRELGALVLGGAIPGVLFAFYHWRCFGSPFALANKYQNPVFVDLARDAGNLWGVLRFIPKGRVLIDLVKGPTRGLVYTQPWVLMSLVLLPVLYWRRQRLSVLHRPFARWLIPFALATFTLCLWMNGCFGGWHGGATPGPRYLSIAFPGLALLMALLVGGLSPFWRQAMIVAVVLSVVLFLLSYGTADILAQPDDPLLPLYFRQLSQGNGVSLMRCLYLAAGFIWASYRAFRSVLSEAHA